MYRQHHFPRGLPGATVAIAIFGVLLVVGCSSDSVTMPSQLAANASDSDSYALSNHPTHRIPTPVDFTVTDLCASGAVLTWKSPGHGLSAQIRVDGVVVDQVRARDGYYLDTRDKSCGLHTWAVCFTRTSTGQVGLEAIVTQVMPGIIIPDPKEPADRMERDLN